MDATDDLLRKALALAAQRRNLPESTYRLQMHAGFTFRDAARIVPYLRSLGITHCYSSPYLQARPGSTHGYDIVNHGLLNPEIGTQEDYDAWVSAMKEHGLGQVLDIVPNHMGVATNDNAWWNDVLENGPASRYAGYFDIAWHSSPRPELQDKVLLPVLGEPYGAVLEAGQLRLAFDFEKGTFSVSYYDRSFPVNPRTYNLVLGAGVEELERQLGPESAALAEYQSILTAVKNLPGRLEVDPRRLAERQREKEVIKRRLAALAAESEPVRRHIEQNVALFNGKPGEPHSFDLLDRLLDQQNYRLAYWRVASDEINYRRFFDINDLAALSMEREDVFTAAHALIFQLLGQGKLDGLRVDHPDGLYDPAGYFRRLQEYYLLTLAQGVFESDPVSQGGDWHDVEAPLRGRISAWLDKEGAPGRWPLYVVAEKILAGGEPLPPDWAVDGTTGYEFINAVNGLFVETASAEAFTRIYHGWVQDGTRFPEMVYRKKLLTLQVSLASELHMLTHQLDRIAQKSRASRDFTFNTLRDGLREVIACFPVYRSYISEKGVHEADRRYVEKATRRAGVRNPLLSRSLFRFVRDVLLQQGSAAEDGEERLRFAGKFQQVTAPVTAKGIEDTAFYVYNRLLSLNEVGGEPDRFGARPEELHAFNTTRQSRWPYCLSPLSTHDTKRSEDVRARINVLSEIPDDWAACLARWSALNAVHRKDLDDRTAPDPDEEYLLYQTLLGAWPLDGAAPDEEFVRRIQAYMVKALHEAKVHSSWVNPDTEYDGAVQEFVARILDEGASAAFLADFRAFQRKVSHFGLFNSLSQTLLKLASPGVPDTYQGTELWDFSLVDPDNRRPVDYERRAQLLREVQQSARAEGADLVGLARSLVESRQDGRIKLYVTWRGLEFRRTHPGLLSAGEYIPVAGDGAKAAHVFAFLRRSGEQWALAAVPRLLTRLTPDASQLPLGAEVWGDTRLVLEGADPGLRWRNVFTGETLTPQQGGQGTLPAGALFGSFPVALFEGQRAG